MSDDIMPRRPVESLREIRARQRQGIVQLGDPEPTAEEAPHRTVRVKQADGSFRDQTFERNETPGLSPLDSAVRNMRSAAYAYNIEKDYTATYLLAKRAFEEVVAALEDKTYMAADVVVVQGQVVDVEPVKRLEE